ncbi:MAG: hypothetical protein K6F32_00705 [Bacilli bacterium]|nr:hypothetical protein [Bacilli bacterium]
MFSDEQYSSSLAKFLSDFDYAIVDTCSLMDDAFPVWMDILHGAKDYLNEDLRIIVPRECYDELKKHSKNKEDAGKRIAAKSAIKIIKKAKWAKLLEVGKKEGDRNFADNVIYVKVSSDRIDKKILIITQDKKLATDLINLNNLASQRGRRLKVCKIGVDGVLVPNHGEGIRQGDKWVRPIVEKEKKSLFGRKTKPQEKPKKAEPANDEIISADAKLKSTIPNGNYPVEKKIEDIKHQMDALSKLSAASIGALKLTYDLPALQKLFAQLKAEKSKKEAEKKAEPAKPEPAQPAPEAKKPEIKEKPKKPEPKEQPKKEEPKPESKPKEPKKPDLGWYEKGSNLKTVVRRLCEHHGILVRDPSIAYDKQAHGSIDFTSNDIDHISELIENEVKTADVKEMPYRSWRVSAQKLQDGSFKVWLNLKPVELKPEPTKPAPEAKKPEPKAKPKKAEPKKEEKQAESKKAEPKAEAEKPAPKKSEKKPAPKKPEPKAEKKPEPKEQPKKSEPKAEPKKPEPKKSKEQPKQAEPQKKAKKEQPKKVEEAPQAATLVVGEPKKKPAKSKAENHIVVRPETEGDKPAPKKAKKKPAEEPEAPKAPKAPKAQEEPKAEEKPKAKKKSPAKKQEAKPAEEPKKPAEAKQPKTKQNDATGSLLSQAQAADKRLKANISNPNYSSDNKVKDINAQIELVKKLTPEERAQLNFGLDALKALAAMAK